MKSRFLFPHNWRLAGYVILFIGLAFIGYAKFTQTEVFIWHNLRSFESQSITGPSINECFDDELQSLFLITGLIVIAFSKERIEDEHIAQLRLESLQWAIYINYAIFLICLFAVYGINFFGIALYNVITPLIIFIIRFRWLMYQERKVVAA